MIETHGLSSRLFVCLTILTCEIRLWIDRSQKIVGRDDPKSDARRNTAMTMIIPTAAGPWQNCLPTGLRQVHPTPLHGDVGSVVMSQYNEAKATQPMAELLCAVGRQRDVEAFEAIFRHFAPKVKGYMARMAGDSQLAEELMQETMVAVWNKADQFDPSRGAVSTWVFTIARNLRIDAFRREKRPAFDPNDPAFVPDDVPQADMELEEQQASEQLHQALAKLPAEQMALLRLSYFEDHSHSAIARILDIPLGTVKSRMRLAFAKLRVALDQTGELS